MHPVQRVMAVTRSPSWLLCIIFCLGVASVACGAAPPGFFPPPPLAPLEFVASTGHESFTARHAGVFHGAHVNYDSEVADAVLRARTDPSVDAAKLFTISYVATGSKRKDGRPVIFAFNGGPGASSVFLNLCGLGPLRIKNCSGAKGSGAGATLIHNVNSPLDVADVVIIDAADTGWSRIQPGADAQLFHSVQGDADSISAVIAWWLASHNRSASPVYIYGESYGSMRAIAVARDLAREPHPVRVAGLLLGGFAINFGSGLPATSPTWQALRLPTVASLAWYYKLLPDQHESWTDAVHAAEVYAMRTYVGAIASGRGLPAANRTELINQLVRITGISKNYFIKHNTILVDGFRDALLSSKDRVLDGNNGAINYSKNNTHKNYFTDFKIGMNALSENVLNVHNLGKYEILTTNAMAVFKSWDFTTHGSRNLSQTLASIMQSDHNMRVLVVQGRYDTQTQLGHTLYTICRSSIPMDRVWIKYFDGGHMLEPTPDVMRSVQQFVLNSGRTYDRINCTY